MSTGLVSAMISAAILGSIGVVIVQNVITSQTTTGWDATVATVFPLIGTIFIVALIVGIFKFVRG